MSERSAETGEPYPCGHGIRVAGCGGCDPGAVEFIRDDGDPTWKPVRSLSANDCRRCRIDLGYQCSPGAKPPVVTCPGEQCASCDYAAPEMGLPPGSAATS